MKMYIKTNLYIITYKTAKQKNWQEEKCVLCHNLEGKEKGRAFEMVNG